MPLDHQGLLPSRVCIPRSHETIKNGETILGQLPPTGHSIDGRIKQSSVKEVHLLVLELQPDGQVANIRGQL